MIVELTETEVGTIITALVLFAHVPMLTMDEDQKRAERLYKEFKVLQAKEDRNATEVNQDRRSGL